MLFAGRKLSSMIGAFALVAVAALGGCENPLDPLDKAEEIKGLTYIDFALTWERWDSDPEYDGVIVGVDYFNEFGDSLSFHDKPHQIVIEFYTQKTLNAKSDAPIITFNKLIYSQSITLSNADDDIRIPVEAYRQALLDNRFKLKEDALLFVIVHVFPPKQLPRPELVVGYSDQTIFKPEVAETTPNP